MATNNPYHEFLRKVYRMRKAQKSYFQNRTQVTLRSAQDLEREVDKWIEAVGIDAAKVKQMRLSENSDQ